MLQHWRLLPPELFAFTIQDAHHGTHPAILHSLHSVAHEPDEEPKRLQGGGSHQRVYDRHHAGLDNGHTHIDNVPLAPPPRCSQAHHSADAPLLSTVPDMLGLGVIVPPCMHGLTAVEVLAWMFSPTRRLMLMPLVGMGVFCYSQT